MSQTKEPKALDTRFTREFLVKLETNRESAIAYLWDVVRHIPHQASREEFEVCMGAFYTDAFEEQPLTY